MKTQPTKTIVFLHIPKTAGQTIHFELERTLGAGAISPIRVHSQAPDAAAQFPAGYHAYSGHIDWEALDSVAQPRFVFTVLRDPLERMASFYFYLRRQAQSISPAELASPARTGMRMALEHGPDFYFRDGGAGWHRFVMDHYYNPYCSYLITRRIRGYAKIKDLSQDELVSRALEAARTLDGIYSVDGLARLEADLARETGLSLNIAGSYANADPSGPKDGRWPRLKARLTRDDSAAVLQQMVAADQILMRELGFAKPAD